MGTLCTRVVREGGERTHYYVACGCAVGGDVVHGTLDYDEGHRCR